MKYSVKEIIEMKKKGVNEAVIIAICKHSKAVNIEEVIELQNAQFSDEAIIEVLFGEEEKTENNGFKGGKVATGSGAFSTDIKDYEPKKDGSNYHWGSYKAKCKAYCYAVASKGVTNCYKKGAVDFDDDKFKDAYDKAKAEFKNTFKYIKKADR